MTRTIRRCTILLAALCLFTFTTAAHAASAVTPPTPPVSSAGMLTAIDGMTSTILQEKQSSFSGIGLRARLQPARLIKEVELMPTVEFWRNSNTAQPYDIHSTRTDATLGCDARYVFKVQGWQPYIGAGFGIHFLSSKVEAPSLGITNGGTSVIKGGLAALVGASFGLTGRLDNFLELKYHHIPEYRQLKINWGLSYRL